MVAVTVKALVSTEVLSVFLSHNLCGSKSGRLSVVHDFWFTRALRNVGVLMKQSPRVAGDEEVANESLKRELIPEH